MPVHNQQTQLVNHKKQTGSVLHSVKQSHIILLLSCFSVSSLDTVFVTLLCIAVEGARCRVRKPLLPTVPEMEGICMLGRHLFGESRNILKREMELGSCGWLDYLAAELFLS